MAISATQPSPALLAAQHMTMNRKNQEVIANNIANASTAGFQSDKPLITQDSPDNNFAEAISFAVNNQNVRDLTPGDIMHTGNAFDIALVTKDVYFSVAGNNGENLYTRNGQMELDQDRQLIQKGSKLPLTDTNHSPITIPAGMNDIKVAEDGTVSANGKIIAKVGAFHFTNSQTLVKNGNTLMKATSEPSIAEKVVMVQRGVESSNVNAVLAMAQMIELQRQDTQDAFVISTFKEQTGQQIDDLLKPLNV